MDDILEVAIPETNNLSLTQLQELIGKLSQTEDGQPLENAMRDLKKALKENPAACSLMLEEDIGECVKHLKRMTNKGILDELSGKNKVKKEKVTISQEDIDNLTMDDLK